MLSTGYGKPLANAAFPRDFFLHLLTLTLLGAKAIRFETRQVRNRHHERILPASIGAIWSVFQRMTEVRAFHMPYQSRWDISYNQKKKEMS